MKSDFKWRRNEEFLLLEVTLLCFENVNTKIWNIHFLIVLKQSYFNYLFIRR